MPEQRRFYVCVDEVKLHFLEFGSAGPDVLVIPGITSTAMNWAFVARRIGEYAHVIVLDNRGRGLSDQRPGLGYSLDDYARDIHGVVQALGLSSPVVLGHSMGARIAIRYGATFPSERGRLVLADPPVSGPGRRPYPQPLQGYLDRLEAARRGDSPTTNPQMPETDEQVRIRTEWLATCSVEATAASHRGFHEEDIFGDLPRITCATLVLYAELGDTIRDADAAEIRALLRNGEVRKVRGVGHMMPWFDLEQFLREIRPFLAGYRPFA
jgi:N-formylmaleamate deformylase